MANYKISCLLDRRKDYVNTQTIERILLYKYNYNCMKKIKAISLVYTNIIACLP